MDVLPNVDLPRTNQQFVLSFCSGGGGLDLGVKLAVPFARTVGYVEIEIPAVCCLVAHMETGALDAAPVWTDLRTFNSDQWFGAVDGILGGYPCQPFSISGKQRGASDPRHLWPYIAEHILAIVPTWCFFENVGNHLRLGFEQVARELSEMGYRVAAGVFTAAEVTAPHRRERLFILAARSEPERNRRGIAGEKLTRLQHSSKLDTTMEDTNCAQRRSESELQPTGPSTVRSAGEAVGNPHHSRSQRRSRAVTERTYKLPAWPPGPEDDEAWRAVLARYPSLAPAIESGVRGMAYGMADRVDRLRILGNGVVPSQAAYAFRCLSADLGL